MKAKITSKGQITIPIEVRRSLTLRTGDELEFKLDEKVLKATKVIDEKAMRSAIGSIKIKGTVDDLLESLRGKVE